jgi:hypothetical protein
LGRGETSPSIAQALHLGDPIERSRFSGRALLRSLQELSHGAHQRRASAQAAPAQAQWLIAIAQHPHAIRKNVRTLARSLPERFHICWKQKTAPAFLHCRIFERKTGFHPAFAGAGIFLKML